MACTLRPVGAPDQLDAGGDVAPLVAAAELERAAVGPVQLEVVHAPAARRRRTRCRRCPSPAAAAPRRGQHPVDREVLADVAQEVEHRHGPGPVEVVDDPGGIVTVRSRETSRPAAEYVPPRRPPSPWCSGRARRPPSDHRSARSSRRPAATAGARPAAGPGPPSAARGCRSAGSARWDRSRHRT